MHHIYLSGQNHHDAKKEISTNKSNALHFHNHKWQEAEYEDKNCYIITLFCWNVSNKRCNNLLACYDICHTTVIMYVYVCVCERERLVNDTKIVCSL